ncbi:MAG: amidohydrolase family protein [Candidatus Bathyarchaeia archaeon]|jgi:beta-aspartyl-dipeptidase (metallo-type)
MFKLLTGGEVYAPEKLGKVDILVTNDRIVAVEENLELPGKYECEVVDATDKIIYPGFVDTHIHFTGADDGQGPVGHTYDVSWQDIVESGVTTAVGTLGGEMWVRTLEQLYWKAVELDKMGLTTYIYTGGFHIPPITITGSVRRDIILLEKVRGLKTAISDATTSHHTWRELAELVSEVNIGAETVKKTAVTHVHVGRRPQRMDMLFELIENTGLDPKGIVPTHVNRITPDVIAQGIDWIKRGGVVDLTTQMRREEGTLTGVKTEYAVKRMLDAGCPIEGITISSDANCPMAIRDSSGKQIGLYVALVDFNRREIRDIVRNSVAPFEEALKMVTTNPARVLGIDDRKGRIKPGYDADIVIANKPEDLKIDKVYSKGNMLVDGGKALFQGHYWMDPYYEMYQ